MTLTVGSLFSGIDLGLERSGMEVRWHSEINDYASRVLTARWPTVPNLGDISLIDWSSVERVDVLAGGFPCQGLSPAGKGKGLDDERTGLWSEFERAIRELRPRWVLVENSHALLRKGLDVVLQDLAELGYDAEWEVVPACAYGAAHTRKRLYLVAYTNRDGRDGSRVSQGERESVFSFAWSYRDARSGEVSASGDAQGEPGILRVVDGVADRMDRIRALGNAVYVPIVEALGLAMTTLDTKRHVQ